MIIKRRELLMTALRLFVFACLPKALARAAEDEPGNFRAVYLDDALRERFFAFLQNVYRLYPEKEFHALILELSRERASDREVYEGLLERLPAIKPLLAEATFALPALKKQKKEMTRQTLEFLGKGTVQGLLEIGSTGRYVSALRKRASIRGPVYLVNDVRPSYSLPDIVERGRVRKLGTFVSMGEYDPFGAAQVPDESVEVATNFIGLHHCPEDRLDAFTASIRRALKPGGRLLHRDHDVDGPAMGRIVALAHDVFNAGLRLPWKENEAQLRLFRSIRDWSAYFEARGFKRTERALTQPGDPTKNVLIELVKV